MNQEHQEMGPKGHLSRIDPPTRTDTSNDPAPAASLVPVVVQPIVYPEIVNKARRDSTSIVLKQVLRTLQREDGRVALVNLSLLAVRTGYSRRTVARALAFGVRVHVLERVAEEPMFPSIERGRPGRPIRYKSLFNVRCSKRGPSPHTPQQRHCLAPIGDGRLSDRAFRARAMAAIREKLTEHGADRFTAAFGCYVHSKGATRSGIREAVLGVSWILPDRWETKDPHAVFAAIRSRTIERCQGHDATEHIIARNEDYVPLSGLADWLRKQQPANKDNFVKSPDCSTDLDSQPRSDDCLTTRRSSGLAPDENFPSPMDPDRVALRCRPRDPRETEPDVDSVLADGSRRSDDGRTAFAPAADAAAPDGAASPSGRPGLHASRHCDERRTARRRRLRPHPASRRGLVCDSGRRSGRVAPAADREFTLLADLIPGALASLMPDTRPPSD